MSPNTRFAWVLVISTVAWVSACSSSSSPLPPIASRTPVPAPVNEPVASPALAAHMLQPADLGPDWYEGLTPAVTVVPGSLPNGARDSARTMVVAMHLVNHRTWIFDENVTEESYSFGSRASAMHYVKSWLQSPSPEQGGSATSNPKTRFIGFVVGNRAYTLRFVPNRIGLARPASRSAILKAAKQRAITGR